MTANAQLSTYGATAILNGTGVPSTLHVQLHTGDPGAAGTANVSTETDRAQVSFGTAVAGSRTSNTEGLISDAAATETITHVSLWDAASGGNCWAIAALSSSLSMVLGHTVRFQSGVITQTMAIWGS